MNDALTTKLNELAELYGIEINDVEPGHGGLFYTDSNGNKERLDDIFDEERK